MYSWGRLPHLLLPFLYLIGNFNRSKHLTGELKSLLSIRISQLNNCEFCLDFNAFNFLQKNAVEEKAFQVENFKSNPIFTETEQRALQYAEEITIHSEGIDILNQDSLKILLGETKLIELTAWICLQNMSSKFNSALNIEPQGLCFKEKF